MFDLGIYTNSAAKYGVTKEEAKIFNFILEDGEITINEIKNLSYEQVKKLGDIMFDKMNIKDEEGIETLKTLARSEPAANIISATRYRPNDNINKALYDIAMELDDPEDIVNYFYKLQYDIMEEYDCSLETFATKRIDMSIDYV